MTTDQIDANAHLDRGKALLERGTEHPYNVADYVAEIAPQLARMATSARLSRLAYLLSLAALDASKTMKKWTEQAKRPFDNFDFLTLG